MSQETPNRLHITEDDSGKRLDNLLFRYARYWPRDYVYRLIRSGQVRLDKKRAKPSTKVRAGQSLRVPPGFFTPAKAPVVIPPAMVAKIGASIAYSDANLVLINKPPGMAAHAGSRHAYGAVELLRAWFTEHEPRISTHFPELVHRLDRLTSGCLLLAKNIATLHQLQQLWRHRQVSKTYTALVHKHVSTEQKVDLPLAVQQQSNKRVVVDHKAGKQACTSIVPQQRLWLAGTPVTLVNCQPEGGRMHQIRVHCQSIGHPIVGDPLYQNRLQHQWSEKVLGECLLLHATRLQFNWHNEEYVFYLPGEERLIAATSKQQQSKSVE